MVLPVRPNMRSQSASGLHLRGALLCSASQSALKTAGVLHSIKTSSEKAFQHDPATSSAFESADVSSESNVQQMHN